jgi:hypothetical protein
MSHPDIFLVSILRGLLEIALLAMLGQGVLGLLCGTQRDSNPIYRLFQITTAPVLRWARNLTPRRIESRHLPGLVFFLCLWMWLALAYIKRQMCMVEGLSC